MAILSVCFDLAIFVFKNYSGFLIFCKYYMSQWPRQGGATHGAGGENRTPDLFLTMKAFCH